MSAILTFDGRQNVFASLRLRLRVLRPKLIRCDPHVMLWRCVSIPHLTMLHQCVRASLRPKRDIVHTWRSTNTKSCLRSRRRRNIRNMWNRCSAVKGKCRNSLRLPCALQRKRGPIMPTSVCDSRPRKLISKLRCILQTWRGPCTCLRLHGSRLTLRLSKTLYAWRNLRRIASLWQMQASSPPRHRLNPRRRTSNHHFDLPKPRRSDYRQNVLSRTDTQPLLRSTNFNVKRRYEQRSPRRHGSLPRKRQLTQPSPHLRRRRTVLKSNFGPRRRILSVYREHRQISMCAWHRSSPICARQTQNDARSSPPCDLRRPRRRHLRPSACDSRHSCVQPR